MLPRKRISDEMNKIFANSVKNYLDIHKLTYSVIKGFDPKSLDNDVVQIENVLNNMLYGVILQDRYGVLMTILPSTHLLDLRAVRHLLDRGELVPVHQEMIKNIIFGCNCVYCPPLPDIYGFDAFFDHSIEYMDEEKIVYFSSGEGNSFIGLKLREYKKLHNKFTYEIFSEPLNALGTTWNNSKGINTHATVNVPASLVINGNLVDGNFLAKRMRTRVNEITDFPAIPIIAEAILRLRNDKSAKGSDLAEIVEKDPSLAAQIMTWAHSASYGNNSEVRSIEEAIDKVLGFDLALNLVLCVAVSKAMKVPLAGPLGLRETWRNALYTAATVEALVNVMPQHKKPAIGLAYLGGLLHDFGYLLMGQIFPEQFELLNNTVSCNIHAPISKVEQHTLKVGHEELASWLLTRWKMPEEIINAVLYHHQEDFSGKHRVYANLVLVALRLLKRHNLGDERTYHIPSDILNELGISQDDLELVMTGILQKKDELNDLISCLFK